MLLFLQFLTIGLLAGIAYSLQRISADFKAIRCSELPQVIGELKSTNRIACEILSAVRRGGSPGPLNQHHLVAGTCTTRSVRGGDSHHVCQTDGEFMVWCWRDGGWLPLSVPPGFTPGLPPEFEGNYEGEAVSVWLPRPQA